MILMGVLKSVVFSWDPDISATLSQIWNLLLKPNQLNSKWAKVNHSSASAKLVFYYFMVMH